MARRARHEDRPQCEARRAGQARHRLSWSLQTSPLDVARLLGDPQQLEVRARTATALRDIAYEAGAVHIRDNGLTAVEPGTLTAVTLPVTPLTGQRQKMAGYAVAGLATNADGHRIDPRVNLRSPLLTGHARLADSVPHRGTVDDLMHAGPTLSEDEPARSVVHDPDGIPGVLMVRPV